MKNILKNLYKLIIFKKRGLIYDYKNIHNISTNFKFGRYVEIIKNVFIGNVYMGDYSYVNDGSKIICAEIGRFCSIGYNCIIGPENHPIDSLITHPMAYDKSYRYINSNNYIAFEQAPRPIIEDNVWIGANSIILRGVKIGEGAIIGANTLVNKDIPPYAIAVGIPAKVIKNRKEIYKLSNLNLKDMTTEEIINLTK